MGIGFACGRGSNNAGNKRERLMIPAENLEKETEKAYGFRFNEQMVWLPKSQITEFERTPNADKVSFWLPMWLITEKALEIFIDTSYAPSLFD